MLISHFSISTRSLADFSHVIIGGGVVGAAVASELQRVTGNSVAVLEQHLGLAMETTARNSEVIHAGLYYPENLLKAKMCIRGKQLIYTLDPKLVPYQRCGKMIVAQTPKEAEYLETLKKRADNLAVPTELVLEKYVQLKNPGIQAKFGALELPTTGITSAHDLTRYFEADFENNGGVIALNTLVQGIEYEDGQYKILTMSDGQDFQITAVNLVNCAGLHAHKIANMIFPPERHVKGYFAKGSYYSFSGKLLVQNLIYPCPQESVAGLGTHLTFDLGNQIRFGPDLEWLDIDDANNIDYDVHEGNILAARDAIATYFPAIKVEDLQPSYAGVRPKWRPKSLGFADYYIKEEDGFPGFVNLLGIESPGLTLAWAIGEYVREIYQGEEVH